MVGYCTNKYYQTREVKDVVNCSNTQTRHSIIFNVRNEGCCSCISGGGAGHQLIRRNQTVPPVPPHSFIFSMISFGSSFKSKKGGEGARSDTHTHRLLGKVRLWRTRGELDPSFLVASVGGHEGHLCVGRGCRWVNEGRWWEEALNANVQRRTNSYWPLKNALFFPHTQLWALIHIYTLLV